MVYLWAQRRVDQFAGCWWVGKQVSMLKVQGCWSKVQASIGSQAAAAAGARERWTVQCPVLSRKAGAELPGGWGGCRCRGEKQCTPHCTALPGQGCRVVGECAGTRGTPWYGGWWAPLVAAWSAACCRCSREVDSAMPCTAPQGWSRAAGCAGSPALEGAGADVDGATVLGSTALTGNCLPFGSPGAVGNTHRTAVVARAPHLSFAVPPEVSRWQKGGW